MVKRHLVFAVLILLLVMQYLTLTHNIEHLLNKGTQDCATCTLAHHFKHSPVVTATIPITTIILDIVIPVPAVSVTGTEQAAFKSRAPPL